MAHLAFIYALKSGEIKNVYFEHKDGNSFLCFVDGGGVLRIGSGELLEKHASKGFSDISFVTNLEDHMFIFDDDCVGEKTMNVITTGAAIRKENKKKSRNRVVSKMVSNVEAKSTPMDEFIGVSLLKTA